MLESDILARQAWLEASAKSAARPNIMRHGSDNNQPPLHNRRRRADKPSVSIIGAGRLGTALGIALKNAGYQIDVVVTKHSASARRAARTIGGETVGLSLGQFALKHPQTAGRNPLIIIATPDDTIVQVADQLSSVLPTVAARATGVVLHTSGALSSEVLRPLRGDRLAVGSLHPLVSISDSRAGAESLTDAYFSLEGDAAAIRMGKRIVRDLGGQSFTIRGDAKALYHAAALMASPNMTALFDIALEMLTRCGLTPARARSVLLPLVASTLENLAMQTPSDALTGTFKRRDVDTVRKHIAAIQAAKLADALAAYVLLGRRSMKLGKSDPDRTTDEINLLLSRALNTTGRQ